MSDQVASAVLSISTDSAQVYQDLEKLKSGVKDVAATVSQTSDAASSDWATMAKAITAVSKQLADQKANTDDLRKGSADLASELSGVVDVAKEVAGALGLAFSIDAAVEFVKGVSEEANQLQNLSLQTRISVEDLQTLRTATKDYGVDSDELGRALFNLQQRIAGGDQLVATAYHLMGLSIEDVKNKNAMDLFLATERGLGSLKGAIQDTAAADLYGGKLGGSLIAFSKDVDTAIAKARELPTATAEDVKAAAEFSKAIDHASDSIHTLAMSFEGKVAEGFNAIADAGGKGASKWEIFVAVMKDFASVVSNGGGTANLARLLDQLNQKTDENTDSVNRNIAAADKLQQQQRAFIASLDDEAQADLFMESVRTDALKSLTDWQQKDLQNLKDLGELNAKNAAGVGVNVEQLDKWIADQEKAKTAAEAAAAAEKKRQEQESEGLLETTKLWDEYSALVIQHSGTTTQKQMADNDKWAADLTAKVQKAGADTEDFYNALYSVIDEKQQSVLINWQSVSANSATTWKQNLQDTADKAAATYQYMTDHAEQFRADTIEKFRDIALNAKNASDDWETSWNDNLDKLDAKLDEVNQKQQDAADNAKSVAQTSIQLSTGGFASDSTVNPLASLPLSVQYALAGLPVSASFVGMPTRDSGGPVSAGMPYLIGRGAQPEMFVPHTAGSMIPAGGYGSTTVNVTTGDVYDAKSFQQRLRQGIEDGLRAMGARI